MSLGVFRLVKRFAVVLCLSALVWIADGCELDQSVNPFYLPQDIIFDENLMGHWRGVDSQEDSSLNVKARAADSYEVELLQKDKEKKEETNWTFEARLFKHEEKNYFDLVPTAFRISGKKQKFQMDADGLAFFVPVHTAVQVDHEDDKLSLLFAVAGDSSSLFEKQDEKTVQEKRIAREKRRLAILAMSTEKLQEEVLGVPPEGDSVIEMGLHFVRTPK